MGGRDRLEWVAGFPPESVAGMGRNTHIVAGPYAADFLTQAAANGDLETVKVLMSHGVQVGASTREGTTAVHAASVGGKIIVIEYLLSRGADINVIDRYGDSPLEKAISMKHADTVKYLIEHGAKRIVGDESLRNKVTEEIVREDIRNMEAMENSRSR